LTEVQRLGSQAESGVGQGCGVPYNPLMDWYITVIDPAQNRVLFAGKTSDETELRAVASEARRMRPQSEIFIRPPMGQRPYEWPA
jgi:hypothetical protein